MTDKLPGPSGALDMGGQVCRRLEDCAHKGWVQKLVNRLNSALKGKINATLAVTLTANAATTTVTDPRITSSSILLFQPLTANAAAALYASPYIFPTTQVNGSVVLNHVNNAAVDKSLLMLVIG